MAKRDTKARKQLRSEQGRSTAKDGIGYFVPSTISKSEWQKQSRKWNAKLQETNFNDIEQFSHDCSGHFSPYFSKTAESNSVSGSSASAIRYYDPNVLEYYRRLGLFYHHAPLLSIFKHHAYLYYLILPKLTEGATLQSLVNWLKKDAPRPLKAKKTIYWAFYHKELIDAAVTKWWNENREWLDE